MSQQVTTAFVNQYRSNVELLLQQKQSKFAPLVRMETQRAEYEYYEQIGPVSAQPWGPRHGDTPLMETPHSRRRVSTSPWIWADLIDNPDRVRMLIEPTSPYATNAVMAFNRRKDDIIIRAALGTAYAGKEGEIPIPFPASQTIEAGAEGITLDKLIEVRQQLWESDVDEDEPVFVALSPAGFADLFHEEKITNADYATVKALAAGDIDTFMGFTFVRTTRLPYEDAGGGNVIRDNLVWVRDGILAAVAEDIKVEIDRRPDKKYSTQVYVEMDFGATRMEEKKVIKLQSQEPAPKVQPAP